MPAATTLTFKYADPRSIDAFILGPHGEVQLMSRGEVPTPTQSRVAKHRNRAKGGEKSLFVVPMAGDAAHLDEHGALAEYDHIFVIDTNTKRLHEEIVSVASVALCTIAKNAGGPGIDLTRKVHVGAYEFRGLGRDQERLGWMLLNNAIVGSPSYDREKRYLIVTDHALREHEAINQREQKLFGDTYLGSGLKLGFATSDSGRGFLQRVIRECDGLASELLEEIGNGELEGEDYAVSDGPVTHLRLIMYDQSLQRHAHEHLLPKFILSGDLPFIG